MDKIDNLDINTLSNNDKGLYLKDIKTKGVYIKDELIASTDFDWMKLFPSLTNDLVDKSQRDTNGLVVCNFSSLPIILKINGINNRSFNPHTLDWTNITHVKSEITLHRDGNKRLRYISIIFASYSNMSLNLVSINEGIHWAAGINAKIVDITTFGPDLADYKGFNIVVLLFDDKP